MSAQVATFQRGVIRPMECISEGWQLVKRDYWLMVGLCFVAILVGSVAPFGILLGPMMCGIHICIFALARGEKPSFNLVFKGFDLFMPSFIATLVQMVPAIAVIVPVYLVFIVLGISAGAMADSHGEPPPEFFAIFFGGIAIVIVAVLIASILIGLCFMFSYQLIVDRGESHPTDPRLVVTDLHVADDRGHEAVKGVSFDVRAGEILGIAGVAGNGQDELVEALTGLRKPTSGTVEIADRTVTGAGPRALQRAGMSFVPGDRHRFGLVLSFPLEDNLVLTQYDEPPFSRGFVRNEAAIHARAKEAIAEFDIRTPSPTVHAGTLSGGNQQKAVVAREFSRKLTVLVLDQPTRGLDVGSIEFIHKQVIAKRDEGAAILLVSAELDEVMEISDRVGVMYRGEIVALVDGPTAEREEIGLLMATGRRDHAALAEATSSMAADLQLAQGGIASPPSDDGNEPS